MQPHIALSDLALFVPILHAARHPQATVCGIILGKVTDQVTAGNAVPLFHTSASIGPCLETSLIQASKLAESSDMKIVGFYEACPHVATTLDEPSSLAQSIACKLRAKGHGSCIIFVVDNVKFGELMSGSDVIPFQVFVGSGTDKWVRGSPDFLSSTCKDIGTVAIRQLSAKQHYRLNDFDDHLDDVRRDWRNVGFQLL